MKSSEVDSLLLHDAVSRTRLLVQGKDDMKPLGVRDIIDDQFVIVTPYDIVGGSDGQLDKALLTYNAALRQAARGTMRFHAHKVTAHVCSVSVARVNAPDGGPEEPPPRR